MSDQRTLKVQLEWSLGSASDTCADPDDHPSAWTDDEGNPNFFVWEEGNYACDCNRAAAFGLPDMVFGNQIQISNLRIAK